MNDQTSSSSATSSPALPSSSSLISPPSSRKRVRYSRGNVFVSEEDIARSEQNEEPQEEEEEEEEEELQEDSRKVKGANFTEEEDELLFQVYFSISEDPIVGTEQKLGSLWVRVEKRMNELIKSEKRKFQPRNHKSYMRRWNIMQKEVSAFNGYPTAPQASTE